jgi:glutaredoxin
MVLPTIPLHWGFVILNMILYTTPTCKYCPKVKRTLDEMGMVYTIKDASEPETRDFLRSRGVFSVPCLNMEERYLVGEPEITGYLNSIL